MLGGLELGCVFGLVDQPDAVRNREVFRGVPAGIVNLKHDDAIASRAHFACEGREQRGEERLVEAIGEEPHHLAAGGGHERGDIEPQPY